MDESPAHRSLWGRLLNSFNVREGELRPSLWLSLQLLLAIASVICLKAASDSIFLSRFDASRLPWVDLTVTALVGLTVGLYIRASNRLPQGWLIAASQVFLAANLLLFWLLLRWDLPGIPALIYVWVGIFAVLIPSQVWSLAGLVFDTRQAKRLFSLIGSGGIIGAAVGGELASVVGPLIGTENILLVIMGMVLACSAIAAHLTISHRTATTAADTASGPRASLLASFRLVRSTRYLTLISLAFFLSTVVSTLIKYQFKAIAKLHYAGNQADLTSFFGDFYGYIAVLSFLFHTLMTGRLLRWFGLGLSLFILPGSLLLGAGTLLLSTSLGSAIAARGADQAFRHSVDRASVELLYVPISTRIRAQVKSFLDMAVNRSADGLASVILLVLLNVVQLQIGEISWASLLFVLPWIAVVWQLRSEYVQTLRSSIERKDISAETLLKNLAESAPAETTELTLQGSDQRAIETAVDWLQFGGAQAGRAELATLLTHESSAIRRKAMAAIATHRIPGCSREARRFLELERDVEARWQALAYLEQDDPERAPAVMVGLLAGDDRDLAATVAARLLRHPTGAQGPAREVLLDYLQSAAAADGASRATAAYLIGLSPPGEQWQEGLTAFLRDEDPEVVRAAAQSTARVQLWDEVPRLLALLQDRRVRNEARRALAAFGEAILDTLNRALRDVLLGLPVRREIPRIIGAVGGSRAAHLLLASLDQPDRGIRYQVLRALIRIRREQPELRFDTAQIQHLVSRELRGYYQESILLEGIPRQEDHSGAALLRRALRERLDQRLDAVFRLLALVYPQREILDAQHWVASGRPELRSNALEFLDSRLAHPTRDMLLPALEDGGQQRTLEVAQSFFELQPMPYVGILQFLLEAPDPWLKSCASFVAAEAHMDHLRSKLRVLMDEGDPLVAETAAVAYERLSKEAGAASPGNE